VAVRAEINDTLAPRRDKVTCKRTLLYLNRVSIHLVSARDANLGDGCRLFIINVRALSLSRRREVVVSSPTHQPPCVCAYCVKCCCANVSCRSAAYLLVLAACTLAALITSHCTQNRSLFFLDCLLGKGFGISPPNIS
jgi:hypothetical protein